MIRCIVVLSTARQILIVGKEMIPYYFTSFCDEFENSMSAYSFVIDPVIVYVQGNNLVISV